MSPGQVVLASLPGDSLLGLGPDRGQASVVSADPDVPQLTADVSGRPGGLGLVGGVQLQQRSVGPTSQVDSIDRAERDERGLPGGAFVRAVAGRFGSDRVGRVFVSVQFPVSADVGGAALPFQPVQRMVRDRAESALRPRRRVSGQVLADPVR